MATHASIVTVTPSGIPENSRLICAPSKESHRVLLDQQLELRVAPSGSPVWRIRVSVVATSTPSSVNSSTMEFMTVTVLAPPSSRTSPVPVTLAVMLSRPDPTSESRTPSMLIAGRYHSHSYTSVETVTVIVLPSISTLVGGIRSSATDVHVNCSVRCHRHWYQGHS